MATIALYNHTARLLAAGDVTLTDLRVMLTSGYAFDAAHEAIASVSGNEVSGSGWTVGGEVIANAAVTTVTTNDAKLDGDDISVTASGGNIGPADGAVIYEGTGGLPLAYVDFEGTREAGEGTPFNITWHDDGIFVFTVA